MSQSILDEAQLLVSGVRQMRYGHPLDDYTRTAQLWSAILGVEVLPEQALLCMCAVKISRECHEHARDNLVDLAGYAACIQMTIEERENRVPKPTGTEGHEAGRVVPTPQPDVALGQYGLPDSPQGIQNRPGYYSEDFSGRTGTER